MRPADNGNDYRGQIARSAYEAGYENGWNGQPHYDWQGLGKQAYDMGYSRGGTDHALALSFERSMKGDDAAEYERDDMPARASERDDRQRHEGRRSAG